MENKYLRKAKVYIQFLLVFIILNSCKFNNGVSKTLNLKETEIALIFEGKKIYTNETEINIKSHTNYLIFKKENRIQLEKFDFLDENSVLSNCQAIIYYKLNSQQILNICNLFERRKSDIEQFNDLLLIPEIKEIIRSEFYKYSIEDLSVNDELINSQLTKLINQNLKNYITLSNIEFSIIQ